MRERAAVVVEQYHARVRPQGRQCVGVVAQRVGPVEGAIHEREWRSVQTVNDEPQPQVDFAFGLRITNCAPCRLSA